MNTMEDFLRDLSPHSFHRMIKAGRDDVSKVRETPNAANQVQYPQEFNNTVPVITALPFQREKVNTIIIATQSPGYTEESFDTDVRKTVEYFELDPGMYVAILLKPTREDLEVLDSVDAVQKLRRVVDLMNRSTVVNFCETERSETKQQATDEFRHVRQKEEVIITTRSAYAIRIVSLGVRSSSFIFKALEFVINQWLVPQKYVQFITNGEIEDEKFMKFWTSACINQLVKAVQFVNLNSYKPFGYYDGSCKKLNKTSLLEMR